jgi:hypothetical protein
MTMLQFISLNKIVQEEILLSCGVYLAGRTDKKFVYDLYQIDGFYVEFFYKPESETTIYVRAFDELDHLDAYLEEIDITCLVQGTTN